MTEEYENDNFVNFTIMKKYIDAQLQVVRINSNDIIATSDLQYGGVVNDAAADAAGRRMDDWDAGY